MSVSFHLDFNGQCEQAFEYYAEHLGGTIGTLLRFKDSPVSSSVAGDWQSKIVHANICIEGVELTGADLLPEQYLKPSGFTILLGVDTDDKVKSIFSKLALNGNTILSPQKTFWSTCYGIVVDQYGVPWKINCST
jgi:PhnB protein